MEILPRLLFIKYSLFLVTLIFYLFIPFASSASLHGCNEEGVFRPLSFPAPNITDLSSPSSSTPPDLLCSPAECSLKSAYDAFCSVRNVTVFRPICISFEDDDPSKPCRKRRMTKGTVLRCVPMCRAKLFTGNLSRAAPHLTTFDGVSFDFLGEHGGNYTVFSVRRRIRQEENVSMRVPIGRPHSGDKHSVSYGINAGRMMIKEVDGDRLVARMRGSPFWTHGMKATFFNAFALSRFNALQNRTDEILIELSGGGSASSSSNSAVHVIVNGLRLKPTQHKTDNDGNTSVTILHSAHISNNNSLVDSTLTISAMTDVEKNDDISSITLTTPDAEYVLSVKQLNKVTRHLDIHIHLRHTPEGDVHYYDGLLGHSLNRLLHPSSMQMSSTDERAPPFELERDIFGDDLELALRERFSTTALFTDTRESRNESLRESPVSYFQQQEEREGEGEDVQDTEPEPVVTWNNKEQEREKERLKVMQYYWNYRSVAGLTGHVNLTGKNLTASIVDMDF